MVTKVFGVSDGVEQEYSSWQHCPWQMIERHVGAKFTDQSREEIFEVRGWYFDWLEAARSAAGEPDIAALAGELLSSANKFVGIGVRCADSSHLDHLFHNLCWERGQELREKYQTASDAVWEVIHILASASDGFAIVEDIRSPERYAFDKMIELIGRPIQGGGAPRGQQWGVGTSEKSQKLRRLLPWMTTRTDAPSGGSTLTDEMSPHKIKNALNRLRKLRKRGVSNSR